MSRCDPSTPYTSFLDLENDAESQRWRIARNNAVRTDRDRKAQEIARAQLETIRNKAVAGLGPQPEVQLASLQPMAPSRPAVPVAPAAPAPSSPTPGVSAPSSTP